MAEPTKSPGMNIKVTPAENKLISFIKQRDPNLTEKELKRLLTGIKRFVLVVQKIYTEPQAQIKYVDTVVEGKKVKKRIIETSIEDLGKVNKSRGMPLKEAIEELNKRVLGSK